MDVLSAEWLCELGMEDEDPNLIGQCQVVNSANHSVDEFILSPESYPSYNSLNLEGTTIETSQTGIQKQLEQLKTNTENTILNESFPFSHVISIGQSQQFNENINCTEKYSKDHEMVPPGHVNFRSFNSQGSDDKLSGTLESRKGSKNVHTTSSRAPLQAQNHVVAERKRRQRLNQKLIALSSLIPGLRKMDKASVLGDAAKYIKQLEERVQILETKVKRKMEEQTELSIKRTRLLGEDDTSSSTENLDDNSNQPLPDIEARVSEKKVLIRIHCKKQDGAIEKLLSEIETLCLNVIISSVIQFGDTTVDITILAQMDDGFRMTVKDLVKNLRSAVLRFM